MGGLIERYDLVIVGMGAGGLAAGRVAASLGFSVAIVERAPDGGRARPDLASKALAVAGRTAHAQRTAENLGLPAVTSRVDLAAVWTRLRNVVAEIAADDDEASVRALGIEVVAGTGQVTGAQQVTVDGRVLAATTILLATGSRPVLPHVPGLADVALTPDDLFALDRPPASVGIVGGGPTGVELAQGLARLGVAVTLVEQGGRLLADHEPFLTHRVAQALRHDGVTVHLKARPKAVHVTDGHTVMDIAEHGRPIQWTGEGVVVAAGCTPNVEDLGLEALGIVISANGVATDRRGRTSVPSIYVAGDLAGRAGSTHVARYEAVQTVRDAFFPLWGSRAELFPSCTFTDPELARVGLSVADAEARHRDDVDVWRFELDSTDRARLEGTSGAIVLVTAKGRLVGAHVLAPAASEMIHELAVAIREGLRLTELATLPHIHPSYSSGIGRLAADVAAERAHKLRWLARRAR